MSEEHQRRAHYRLRYPEAEHLVVEINDCDFRVVELSEAGLRIQLAGTTIEPGSKFNGILRFQDDDMTFLRGVWLRMEDGQGVVQLSSGISLKKMIEEQRRLIRLYPQILDESQQVDEPDRV